MSMFGTRFGTRLGTRLGTQWPDRATGGPVFTTGLIDDLINAGAAAPIRALFAHRLYSAYSSTLWTVRSAAGGTQAIGATTAGLLDTAAIAAFCGSNDGFLVTVHDQSGNGRDHTQATPAEQPKVYDGATGQTLTYGVALNPAPNFTRASAQSLVRTPSFLNAASDYTAFWGAAGGTTGTQSWVSEDPLRLGSATSNACLYLNAGGTNRQFTPATALTTVGSYLCSFASGTLSSAIGIEQNGTNLAQASNSGGSAVGFMNTGMAVGSQSDASANAQQGPLIWAITWASVLNATQQQICRDFGADNI